MANPEIGKCYKDKDTLKTDTLKNIDMSELPFGRVASYFYEKLKEINPRVKPPNLTKWAKQIELLVKDGNSEADVIKAIDYIISTFQKPSSNGFCWANVVLSPEALRKNFPKIWGEMHFHKKSQNFSLDNHKLAQKITKEYAGKDLIIGNNYLEFINGPIATHIKFDDKSFKEVCLNELRKRNFKLNV